MKLSKLEKCPDCHGTGYIKNPNRPPDWYDGEAESWQPDEIECHCQDMYCECDWCKKRRENDGLS